MGVRRVLLFGGGTVTLVAVAQAANLALHYQSPPDPAGPQGGVEVYRAKALELQVQGRVLVDAASEKVSERVYGARNRVQEMWKSLFEPGDGDWLFSKPVRKGLKKLSLRTSRLNLDKEGHIVTKDGDEECCKDLARGRRILFIGDSLVQGVGCEGSNGPALPRHAARFLAEKWKMDVSWRALGITGGDVRTLRTELIPLLRDEVAAVKARRQECGNPELENRPIIDAVFIVCGVNDWKKFFRTGRTWRTFRIDLEELVRDIKELCGDDCRVILPALPGVDFAPLFHEPLRSFVRAMSNCWDQQKRYLAEKLSMVHFVDKPESAFWAGMNPSMQLYAPDRVHPNELGYSKWGEYLADSYSKILASDKSVT
eukprot:Plantae.Rhodophyta-Purpureofilum_apyrenoidigerum.ctg49976.p1 GENE.Plantae.Rhodophyta-Purpureofilum_apyrenoidigerum.ctg49976~~Plantae.Rhodophyta-Purpureofilum_apyrenoidigerum.ctg49976.p1  ORF type:complete len:370 (-),score=46.14 Plantae.Rhodophyta-Purpureofilum_apyrenoidigerum.ctg49976:2-1111(-)